MESLFFTATEAGVHEDEHCLVAGVASADSNQYVTFQRNAEGSNEDWGIHFEFNDQINSAYECIRKCNLSRHRLIVELTSPVDWQKKIAFVDAKLTVSDDEFEKLVRVLRRIFRDREPLLTFSQD